jgi:hypothetical protein
VVSVTNPYSSILGFLGRIYHYNVSYILENKGSVVCRVILANIILLEDGRTTETCSSLGSIKLQKYPTIVKLHRRI